MVENRLFLKTESKTRGRLADEDMHLTVTVHSPAGSSHILLARQQQILSLFSGLKRIERCLTVCHFNCYFPVSEFPNLLLCALNALTDLLFHELPFCTFHFLLLGFPFFSPT